MREWIAADSLGCTGELHREPEGWVERVELLPAQLKPWTDRYQL